jgi:hypothetical protein
MFCLSARNSEKKRRKRIANDLAWCSRSPAQSGTPDCPALHRTVSGLASGEQATLGKNRRRTAIIHQTVRWCTGLSGEPTIVSATVGCAIRGRRVARANGRQGAPDCSVCTGQCAVRHLAQRCNGRLRQNRKEIGTGPSIVTVRCATRQKATIVLVGLQLLLAALGL